jgi:diadenylate cyclase
MQGVHLMNQTNCDFSPLKQQITDGLKKVSLEIDKGLDSLQNENYCLLGKLEDIKDNIEQIETIAASFYLNCYLSPYTDKYLELSACIQHLSHQRHGALIAIERKNSLDDLIKPGTPIGATLTSSLLESIFFPGNPLHDGAVLVRNNEVFSAANVLPLSSRVIREKKLGTRHRAALGLTEKSDALVLVVSEESGRVSLALEGNLYPIITTSSLI